MKYNKSGKSSAAKTLKGFTLIELLVVIAIIAILAGMSSMIVTGYMRDSRLETNNERARLIYTAFQDILINCEVTQDNSIFEGHDGEDVDNIIGAVIFFRISDYDANGVANVNGTGGLGDEIHVMSKHSISVTNGGLGGDSGLCSRSFWKEDTSNTAWMSGAAMNLCDTDASHVCTGNHGIHGAKRWETLNGYISTRMDRSMEGSYVVVVDLVNYEVLSVIYRELVGNKDPKTGLYDSSETNIALGDIFGNSGPITWYEEATSKSGSTISFPVRTYLIKDLQHEKDIWRDTGVYVGCYPYGDTVYTDITSPY